MKKWQIFVQSVYAGFAIGIGAVVKLSVENKTLGALLFSFGLLTVVVQGFYLYTGKIGFVEKFHELFDMLIVVAGNFVGTLLMALIVMAAGLPLDCSGMVRTKLDNSIGSVFFLSVLCGVMMYLAIDNYNKDRHIVFIIAPVMIFILARFEHSVANMFYFNLAGQYSFKAVGYLLLMVVGNGIGAKLFSLKSYLGT